MLVNGTKKMFLYHVDPLFFRDSSGDGFGDFRGFLEKIGYFEFLGIDGVIFPDLFNQEGVILKPNDVAIFNKYGRLVEFRQIIEWFKSHRIDFLMEISLKDILNSNMNANLEDKTSAELLVKKRGQGANLDWSNEASTRLLLHIITFWTKRQIHNFVLTNFETLVDDHGEWNAALIARLEHIYRIIKSIDPGISIALKSSTLGIRAVNAIFTNQLGKTCDYYIDGAYGRICTHKTSPTQIREPFVAHKLFQRLAKIQIAPAHYHKYIIAFDSNQLGRISSRWFDETALHSKASKTFLLLANFLPYSAVTYYGNELGMLRTKITHLDQYYDFDYNEHKRKLESQGYPEEQFHHSQRYLSPIHAQSLFAWDGSAPTGGFSSAPARLRQPALHYQQLNVRAQLDDATSVLNFYRQLIQLIKHDPAYKPFFQSAAVLKIKKIFREQLFVYQLSTGPIRLNLLINPTNRCRVRQLSRKQQILLSSYSLKALPFNRRIKFINPYESFVYVSREKPALLTRLLNLWSK